VAEEENRKFLGIWLVVVLAIGSFSLSAVYSPYLVDVTRFGCRDALSLSFQDFALFALSLSFHSSFNKSGRLSFRFLPFFSLRASHSFRCLVSSSLPFLSLLFFSGNVSFSIQTDVKAAGFVVQIHLDKSIWSVTVCWHDMFFYYLPSLLLFWSSSTAFLSF
jgi:hypothetical protein